MSKESLGEQIRPAYLQGMQAFLRLFLVISAVFLLLLALVGVARADEVDRELSPEPQAEGLSLLGGLIEIGRPTGWTFAAPASGALATLRSASDRQAQIEVRSSDGVTATRWENYQRTFDTELQHTGFIVHQVQGQVSFGERSGTLREYELQVEELSYRLLVWHTHHDDRAWVFAIFFPTTRRSAHLQSFEEFLSEIQWNDSSFMTFGAEREGQRGRR